jgi:hypothetical protein
VDLLGALEQAVLGLRVDGRLSMSLLERVNEITEAAALEFLGS